MGITGRPHEARRICAITMEYPFPDGPKSRQLPRCVGIVEIVNYANHQ